MNENLPKVRRTISFGSEILVRALGASGSKLALGGDGDVSCDIKARFESTTINVRNPTAEEGNVQHIAAPQIQDKVCVSG